MQDEKIEAIRGTTIGTDGLFAKRDNVVHSSISRCSDSNWGIAFNFDPRYITIKPDRGALNWREQPYGAAASRRGTGISSEGRFARPSLLDCSFRVNTTESGGLLPAPCPC